MHAAGLEKGEALGGTKENGTLRVDLTAQGAVRHHGDFGDVRLGRHPGARVDQMMHRVSPSTLARPAGADATVAERDQRSVAEPDVPAVAFGTGAAHAEIAAQVADRVLPELIDEKVGQRPLRDSTKVERRAWGERCRACGLIQEEHLRQWRQFPGTKTGGLPDRPPAPRAPFP